MQRFFLPVFLPLVLLACSSPTQPPPPQISGDRVTQLTYPVEVWRDNVGIPHIRAQGPGDLLFAQGYEMARDRLWHLDWFRRYVYGTRAEAYGAGPNGKYHDDDIVKRALGFKRLGAQQATYFAQNRPQIFGRIESFCNGVNAYLADAKAGKNGAVRPTDLDRIEPDYWPEPWQPADVFALAKALVFSQNFQGDVELILYGSQLLLGAEKFADLYRFQPMLPTWILETAAQAEPWPHLTGTLLNPWKPQVKTLLNEQQREQLAQATGDMAQRLATAMGKAGPGVMGGSNSWALSKEKTDGKSSILCNDPHMALEWPPRLYAMHLIDGAQDDTGAFGHNAVGMPWLTFGATARVAWGITNSFSDTTDLYDEIVCGDGNSVQFQGQCVPMELHTEIVKVRPENGKMADAVAETHTVRWVPHHGPVLNDILPPSVGDVLKGLGKVFSAKWPGFSPQTGEAIALAGMLTAETVDDALQTLGDFDGGVLNLTLADRTGRIAYIAAGHFPQRAHAASLNPPWLPLDGSGPEEWTGVLQGTDQPQVKDPQKHYVATANNQQGPQDNDNNPGNDSVYWGHFYDLGTRAWRISELLEKQPNFTLAQATAIQGDVHSVLADGLLPLLLSQEVEVCKIAGTPECNALQLLKKWNGEQTVDSAAGAIWTVWLAHVVADTIGDDMPSLLLPLLSSFLVNLGARDMAHWLEPGFTGKTWWDDAATTDHLETAGEIAVRALAEAVTELTALEGADQGKWKLGDVHQAKLQHLVWNEWSVGPLPHAGGARTVNAGDYAVLDSKGKPATLPYVQTEGAVFRFCVQLSAQDPVGNHAFAGGQQSQHDAPHAADQFPDWLSATPQPIAWTRAQVEALPAHVTLPAGLGQ